MTAKTEKGYRLYGLYGQSNDYGLNSPLNVVHPFDFKEVTDRVYKTLFPPITTERVDFVHALLVGLQSSGKTTALNAIAAHAVEKYGNDVNIISVYSLKNGIERLNSKPVQMMFLDDAVKEANSRLGAKNADDIGDFYEIRHAYERIVKRDCGCDRGGITILLWASQRFKSLDIVFRNAPMIIFKSAPSDPDDAKLLEKYIGNAAMQYLKFLTRQMIIEHRSDIKKNAIVWFIDDIVGHAVFEMRPNILNFENYSSIDSIFKVDTDGLFKVDFQTILEGMKHKRKWKKSAEIMFMYRFDGLTIQAIAEKLDCDYKTPQYHIHKIRGELSRMIGASYEQWKKEQYEKIGYTVIKRGGVGSTDLVITDKAGKESVVSLKAMDLSRKVNLPTIEIKPEILEARRKNCDLMLSVVDYNTGLEREIAIDWRNGLKRTIEINMVDSV